MSYYLAIDIGASSGRHILGSVCDGKLQSEEIYRFDNAMVKKDGMLCWDVEALFSHILAGIARCKDLGKMPKSLAIDTWGVDYVLLDYNGDPILPVRAYRDSGNNASSEKVHGIIPFKELYEITGIQMQPFNTVYQLYYDKTHSRLDNAQRALMIPDYFSYKLTGVMKNEYTNATTGAFVNAHNKKPEREIFKALGIQQELLSKELSLPCTAVGDLLPKIQDRVGFNCQVLLCPSHDTASAVAACPLDDDTLFLSSGTWSLMGTEIKEPITSCEARKANFTNEGGIEGRFRFLKNIMGMWLLTEIRKNIGKKFTYDEMMTLASKSSFVKIFDVNHPSLSSPENMLDSVRELIGEKDLPLSDTLNCVYNSLAYMYAKTAAEIEELTKRSYSSIFIVGGGSRDSYLNSLTAKYTKKRVLIGLSEATATGNILSQIMAEREINLDLARELVRSSFNITEINNG